MREELEQKIQESQRLRQEEEEQTKEELQRLSEAILQLEAKKCEFHTTISFLGFVVVSVSTGLSPFMASLGYQLPLFEIQEDEVALAPRFVGSFEVERMVNPAADSSLTTLTL
ncbi:hypothetical protein D4764_11G0010400 [Takifugu flavidus]|uniref:Uncharacterized protein n=1 Tax=Takifugu flavidus TaxID=433684 RepID=A0A5C6PJ61_9TELE|nr:hypothetical protein D4764_11G0010400 [Takifugu flavidus]